MATAFKKLQSPQEIAQELQNEVNSILSSVTEHDIHSEIREIDIVELENGIDNNVHESVIDERINYKLSNHQGVSERIRIYERTDSNTGLITRITQLLFKPFQF